VPYSGFGTLTIDPVDPTIIYASGYTSGVYKRMGGVWQRMGAGVLPPPGGSQPCCAILPIGPAPTTLFVIGVGAFYKSPDRGDSWAPVPAAPPGAVNSFAYDPASPGLIYAGTSTGIYTSADGGDHWQPLTPDLPATSVSLTIDPATSTFYTRSTDGFVNGGSIYSRSTDHGNTWQPMTIGLSTASIGGPAVDPITPSTV
jgi:hypothetical protein